MNPSVELETKRLKLRQWKNQDYLQFAKLNADPKVMEFPPSVLTKMQSDTLADEMKALIAEKGWGSGSMYAPNLNQNQPKKVR